MAKHVVIVGGGVIGLSTAYYCVQRGWHVTVVDRNAPIRDGCSFQNAGMIVPSHFVPLAAPGMVALGLKWMWNPASPFYVKPRLSGDLFDWGLKFWRAATPAHVRRAAPLLRDLSFASRACFEELAALPGSDFGLVQHGSLMLCQTAHGLDEEAHNAELARSLGITAEVLDAAQVAALEPGVRMAVAGAVLFPDDGHLAPDRFMSLLQDALDASGATFAWNTEVTDWHLEGRTIRALTTRDQGAIDGDEFVLCGGSWSSQLARSIGLALPMQAGKGYSLTLPRPRQLPQRCAILTEARVAVTPVGDALRFAGTMEIAGLDDSINPIRVHSIAKAATQYYPEFELSDFDGVVPWRGLRPCSPDGMPYIGRTTACGNLAIATGHAMMGMSLGPITGRLVAQVLAGETPPFAMPLLSPDRYARR
ncbi:MAG: FAD-dependent oxidoreductase [Casimicrobiaceae bacterium]